VLRLQTADLSRLLKWLAMLVATVLQSRLQQMQIESSKKTATGHIEIN